MHIICRQCIYLWLDQERNWSCNFSRDKRICFLLNLDCRQGNILNLNSGWQSLEGILDGSSGPSNFTPLCQPIYRDMAFIGSAMANHKTVDGHWMNQWHLSPKNEWVRWQTIYCEIPPYVLRTLAERHGSSQKLKSWRHGGVESGEVVVESREVVV